MDDIYYIDDVDDDDDVGATVANDNEFITTWLHDYFYSIILPKLEAGDYCLSFAYNMQGEGSGYLRCDDWRVEGDQGNTWHTANINVSQQVRLNSYH